MKTVFLFAPNYVYSSDFLRTRFIQTLAERFRVFVFLPMASDSYPKHEQITYIPWEVQFPQFWLFWGKTIRVPLIRMFDHEPLIQRNYQLSFGHWKRKLLRRAAFLFPKRFWNPDFISRLEQQFLPECPRFVELVREHQPSLVITATPGFTELDAEAITLARRAGTPTAAIDFSWDNLTSNCKHLRKTDYLICWTERMRDQALVIHRFLPERVFVSGIMRFDHYFRSESLEQSREEFLKGKGLNPGEKTILVTTVTKGNYRDEPAVIRKLIEARERGTFPGFPNIFIRIHPKENNYQEYEELAEFRAVHIERSGKEMPRTIGSKIEMDEADLINLKETLRHADVVVNYASTISLEACVLDKPVINIAFPPYYRNAYSFTHYKPVVATGAVKVAESEGALLDTVQEFLEYPEHGHAERAQAVREFIGFTDGQSYRRVVAMLEQIVSSLDQTGTRRDSQPVRVGALAQMV